MTLGLYNILHSSWYFLLFVYVHMQQNQMAAASCHNFLLAPHTTFRWYVELTVVHLFKIMPQHSPPAVTLRQAVQSYFFKWTVPKEHSNNSSPKTVNSVIVYSSSCRSKPLCPSFYCNHLKNVSVFFMFIQVSGVHYMKYKSYLSTANRQLLYPQRKLFDIYIKRQE